MVFSWLLSDGLSQIAFSLDRCDLCVIFGYDILDTLNMFGLFGFLAIISGILNRFCLFAFLGAIFGILALFCSFGLLGGSCGMLDRFSLFCLLQGATSLA